MIKTRNDGVRKVFSYIRNLDSTSRRKRGTHYCSSNAKIRETLIIGAAVVDMLVFCVLFAEDFVFPLLPRNRYPSQ